MNDVALAHGADFRLSEQYQELKWGFHRHVIRVIEDGGVPIDRWSRDKLREFVLARIQLYIAENRLAVNRREANILALDTIDELVEASRTIASRKPEACRAHAERYFTQRTMTETYLEVYRQFCATGKVPAGKPTPWSQTT